MEFLLSPALKSPVHYLLVQIEILNEISPLVNGYSIPLVSLKHHELSVEPNHHGHMIVIALG